MAWLIVNIVTNKIDINQLLSGSGKSTLSHAVKEKLYQQYCRAFVFYGDNVRYGLSSGLGFSDADRKENICSF